MGKKVGDSAVTNQHEFPEFGAKLFLLPTGDHNVGRMEEDGGSAGVLKVHPIEQTRYLPLP